MNCFLRFILLLCCLFVFCKQEAYAQLEGNISETAITNNKLPFTVTHYSTKDGLPQNQVLSILRKNSGELILQTYNGVVEFNGYRFSPVIIHPDYKNQAFRSIYYFKNKNLLMGLNSNLAFISPDYKELQIASNNILFCLPRNDSLFIVSNRGNVYLYLPDQNKTSVLFINRNPYPNYLNVESYGSTISGKKIYINSNVGLFSIDLETQKNTMISPYLTGALETNPYNGKVYVTDHQTIYTIENNRLMKYMDVNTGVPFEKTINLLFMDSSSFYMGTVNGLVYVGKDSLVHYTMADGLPSSYIQSLYYDHTNHCLFAGTAEKGFLKLQFRNNYPILPPEGPYKKTAGSVIKTADNQIVTTVAYSLYNIHKNSLKLYLPGHGDYSCLSNINGLLYGGTWGDGVFIYKDFKLIDSISGPKHLPHKYVHACFRDSRGMLWIGTGAGIARGGNNDDVKPLLTELIKGEVICFYELRNGDICIGSTNGAYILRNDVVIARLDIASGFRGKEVRAFYEDDKGKLWIGTYGGGLFCYEKNRFTSINAMRHCMLDVDAFCIAKDRYGYFYFSSNHGLWRVSEKDLNAFYEKKLPYLIPFHYMEETGFLNTEFNGGFQNNFLSTDGYFIFPTVEGVVKTIPEKPLYNPLLPKIYSIRVNDTLAGNLQQQFERSTYSIQFDFQCVNFLQKNNVCFQHKLIGETNYEWSPPQKQTTVYLKMLPPGKYTFMVRAIDGFNDPKPYLASYTFEIKPYFYETIWFRILATTILTILIVVIVRIRFINNKKKIEQREYYKRKISEVELTAIQAQLNPHFIFNCMNTIKYFILEKDFTNASAGLNKLSRLIRNSLENSEKMFIPLGQEMLFTSNYLELEKMRLREHLSYTILIDDHVDTNNLIPQLFIQPHVENAIKHGIANLENRQGILKIEIVKTGAYIVCTIEDNGIGRNASSKLIRDTPHISKGTRLTEEKSQLLKQYYNYRCNIETIDLYTETGESQGTRIIISMPDKYKSGNILSL